MKRKSFLQLFTTLLALSMILAACSGNNNKPSNTSTNTPPADPSGDQKEVTISIGYATGDPSGKKATEDVIDAFMKAYPNIKIKNLSETTSDSYLDWLKTKDAVGEFPDVIEMRDTKVFADAGKLAELPEELHSLFTFLPAYDGKYYNAPLSANAPNGILYSKKAYADAGVTELPKTYDEFLEIQKKLKASGISPIVVGGKDLFHMGFWANYFLITNVFAEDPDWNSKRTAKTASFTDAQFVQAITDYKELFTNYVDKGWLSTADNQTASILVSGKAAQLFSGPWMIGQIMEADPSFEFGFYPLPDRKGNLVINGLPTLAGWSLSAEAAKDADKVDAFKKFINFFFDPAQYAPYSEKAGSIPSIAAKVDIKTNEVMQQVLDAVANPDIKKSMMINQWYGENAIPPQFRNWFYKLLQDLVMKNGDVTDYMKQADVEYDNNVKANQQ
ncbi:hypothetical protein PAECIP111893_03064 [Paenibacillus plantiphilus]|uniref:ABC transporter substrate-binding protein n=1 Tax=Paenibacillus plantiphilus TaxID=2905650 RepID=A0ABN8GLJ0_9BACL|nr:extracellular solute-binding protein [Paenibacillus plantiphilus]CAH1209579.1 hypothetical protein PAECIP111893_03064 [Paenibacillus plantiphilus]